MAYLDMVGINTAITFLGDTHPTLASVFTLPGPSRNGSTMRGYRLGAGSKGDRRAVLALGGVHARELVNPDMLISLSIKLCQAYTDGSGLDFGGTSFAATDIKLVLDALDVHRARRPPDSRTRSPRPIAGRPARPPGVAPPRPARPTARPGRFVTASEDVT